MIVVFAKYIVPMHRVQLVISTVLIGIYASLLTVEPSCIAYWLACLGAGMGMYESDVYREIDSNAILVAAKGDHKLPGVRYDVFQASTPRLHMILFATSVFLIILGFVLGA